MSGYILVFNLSMSSIYIVCLYLLVQKIAIAQNAIFKLKNTLLAVFTNDTVGHEDMKFYKANKKIIIIALHSIVSFVPYDTKYIQEMILVTSYPYEPFSFIACAFFTYSC